MSNRRRLQHRSASTAVKATGKQSAQATKPKAKNR
jgi:hypothetical protein